MTTVHRAVLVEESMRVLDVKPGGRYLDGTLGGATHSEELLRRSAPDGRVLSLDVDPKALERAKMRLAPFGDRWIGVEENFRRLDVAAAEQGMAPLDGVLLDLGLSSDELSDPFKGLSFQQEGPLDMRLGPKANLDGLTAAEIVNSWSPADLERLLREFGEERYARRIALEIVKARKASRIVGTLDLVAVIKKAVPASYEHGRIHPATRTFQALRIAVNDELYALTEAMEAAHRVLKPGGRLAIISFHSLEDRIVKNAFRSSDVWKAVTKKPLVPTEEEVASNPRSRSAKLRAAVRVQKAEHP
jgi:16S rRNA (cytosine1402-N4)-methyltransferase